MPEVSNEAFDTLPQMETADVLAADPMATDLQEEEGNKLKKMAKLTTEKI